MKLLNFNSATGICLGVKTDKGIFNISAALNKKPNDQVPRTMDELLQNSDEALAELKSYLSSWINEEDDEVFLNEEQLKFAPSVPRPNKIICVGLNYRKHAIETNLPLPKTPILFNKFNNALAAHGDPIILPEVAKQTDYEAELAIVIGKTAKNIAEKDASQYILGYSVSNDLSARDLQFATSQWLLGKSLDGFYPLGPYLVTSEEVANPDSLAIRTYLNDRLVQNSSTADMVFNCSQIVSYISKHMTLEPGDVISTGTPEGVIMGNKEEEQIWLKAGDVVTVEIEGLGKLTNTMVN